ncbi:EAL domain-containing protein [Shinella sp. CPCC 100929]|uniref:EAL domain-containing protein n=2 Tax=Shinella lacus TaxID=2654216 RepID=A0ABT1REU4_9HYPH|nr:EAL domain-containing protein [Shinella lacus]
MTVTPRLRARLFAVSMTSALILSTLGGLAYVVSAAISSMAASADEMDDMRALAAAKGALDALRKQLGATVRDNAYWDDAYLSLKGNGAQAWATENWGATTADYPLYDTAIVLDAAGSALMAYHKGITLTDEAVERFFLGKLPKIVAAARDVEYAADDLPVAFAKTSEGMALVGAAAIQPADDAEFDMKNANVLLFSKQMSANVVAEIARTFSIAGLAVEVGLGNPAMLHADVLDIDGHEIGRVTWPPMHPGTASYIRARPTIILAAIVLVSVLLAVVICGLLIFRGLRKSEQVSRYKARHDALTGLWNRAGCLEQLDEMLRPETGGSNANLYILDLDGFKPVNDAWGHPVGDKLINAVAVRLLEGLPVSAIVARLGGDEFAVLSATDNIGSNFTVHETILRALSIPFKIEGRTIEIGGSIGWARAGNGALDSTELLRRADLALYRAKSVGRGVAVEYEPGLDEEAIWHAELEQELRLGLLAGEIHVVFQPLIEASTREIGGVEALARWTSPTRGPISPETFIGVAEKAGLIDQLGLQVLRMAIQESAQWPSIGVAVNISPLQLKNPYLCRQIKEVLEEYRFHPARLTIEVTEGVFISNPDQAKRAFDGLRKLGVKIALDDFGCGYASIGTLREFGFDSMKIDRSLVFNLDKEGNGGAVLHATIALANALNLPVTAEGIETEAQATAVRLSGCDRLQGYLFSKPVDATEITRRYFKEHQQLVC